MNVFGQRERSWRKAQKRAVSPIIATILLVAITVVLAAVLYVLISGLTHGPGSTPIGTAFSPGTATPSTCAGTATAVSVATTATLGASCLTSHAIYTIGIASSTVTFGSVLFEVLSSSGSVVGATAAAGFSIVNTAGAVVATYVVAAGGPLAMSATFTFSAAQASNSVAYTTSTPLTGLFTIVVDMGQTTATTGLGYTLVALGTGSFSGSTNPISLP